MKSKREVLVLGLWKLFRGAQKSSTVLRKGLTPTHPGGEIFSSTGVPTSTPGNGGHSRAMWGWMPALKIVPTVCVIIRLIIHRSFCPHKNLQNELLKSLPNQLFHLFQITVCMSRRPSLHS